MQLLSLLGRNRRATLCAVSVFPAIVGPIGPLELGIILLIVIVIFGPKRLPGIGRSLGEGMREFKDSVTGKEKEERELPPPAPNIETNAASTHETDKVSTS